MYIGYLVFNSEKSDRDILIQIIDITKAIRHDTEALRSMIKPLMRKYILTYQAPSTDSTTRCIGGHSREMERERRYFLMTII
jgi:hypothetical protein